MRIATYNLWNAPGDWERRLLAIADELGAVDADVVALQEAPVEASAGRTLADFLATETGYRYVSYKGYATVPDAGDRPEGLAVLSHLKCGEARTNWESGIDTGNSYAMRLCVETPRGRLGITNVHLDWEHPDRRVGAIADICGRLIGNEPADIEVLCGDFNDYEDGPVAEFLSSHGWQDAVVASDPAAPVTLDFADNPRWKGTGNTERPGRFDRIYLRSRSGTTPRITGSGRFGKRPANRFDLVPSDHYGVFVDLEI